MVLNHTTLNVTYHRVLFDLLNIIWVKPILYPTDTIQRASRSAMSFAALARNYKMASKKGVKIREGWKKPPEGKVMVNVDAGFD